MFRSTSLPNKYELSEKTKSDSSKWKENYMYKSSYHVMSEKNVNQANFRKWL